MEQSLDKVILEAIITARKQRKISREELSNIIDFPLGTVNDIEGGRTKRIPGLFLLAACQYLNIDVSRTLDRGKIQFVENVINVEDVISIEDFMQDLKAIKVKLDRYDDTFFNEIGRHSFKAKEISDKSDIQEGNDTAD
jgi:transcriptional regulator with XRE-family HTH domain